MVSPDGGTQPRWGRDGELFYVQGDSTACGSANTGSCIRWIVAGGSFESKVCGIAAGTQFGFLLDD